MRFRIAERLRTDAIRTNNLKRAWRLYKGVTAASTAPGPLRERATDRMILMLCQRGAGRGASRRPDELSGRLLHSRRFVCRLSPNVLHYRRSICCTPVPASLQPAPATAHAVDMALPHGMLGAMERAFSPGSPFWTQHQYSCGKSPFFSYVHRLDRPPRNGFERVLAHLLAHARARFPKARAARYAEWWAHCRPHGIGHQLHYDSDGQRAQWSNARPLHRIASVTPSLII